MTMRTGEPSRNAFFPHTRRSFLPLVIASFCRFSFLPHCLLPFLDCEITAFFSQKLRFLVDFLFSFRFFSQIIHKLASVDFFARLVLFDTVSLAYARATYRGAKSPFFAAFFRFGMLTAKVAGAI